MRKSVATILLISAALFVKDTSEMPCLLGLTGLAIGSKIIGKTISNISSGILGGVSTGISGGLSGGVSNTVNYNTNSGWTSNVNVNGNSGTNININTSLDNNIIADVNGNIYGKIDGCIITDLLGKTVAKINKTAKTILDLKGKIIGTIITDVYGNITGIAENSDFWNLDWNTSGQSNVSSIIKINNNIITDINGNIYGDISGTKVCNCLGKQIAKINTTKKLLLDLNGKTIGNIKCDSKKNVIEITGNDKFYNMNWNNKLNYNTNIMVDGNVITDVNGNFYGRISGTNVIDILGNVVATIVKTKKAILDLKGNIIASLVYNASGIITSVLGNTNFWKIDWSNNTGITGLNTNIIVNGNTVADVNGNVFGKINHKSKCINDSFGKKIATYSTTKKTIKNCKGNIIGTIIADDNDKISNIICNADFWNMDWNVNGVIDCSLKKNAKLSICKSASSSSPSSPSTSYDDDDDDDDDLDDVPDDDDDETVEDGDEDDYDDDDEGSEY